MEIISSRNLPELSEKVVALLQRKINAIIAKKGLCILGIPGGRSVSGIFTQLKSENIPWNKVHIFWADERKVPVEDAESNYKLAYDLFLGELLRPGKISAKNIHPGTSAAQSTKELQQYGGAFDIVLLGVGEDGHIASLFPHHLALLNASPGFIEVHQAPKLPAERISASRTLIQASATAILLFVGKEKEKAYENFINVAVPEEECPAKMLEKVPEVYVFTCLG